MKHKTFGGHLNFGALESAVSAGPDTAPHIVMSSSDPERTVRAGRRRPSGGSTGPRERADTPERESSGGGGGGGGGGGLPPSFRPGSGGGLPSNINPWILIVGAILLVCIFVVFGGSSLLNTSDESANAPQDVPTQIVAQAATLNLPSSLEACIELAKYYEWHASDLPQALAWTEQALALAGSLPDRLTRQVAVAEVEHRKQRLVRKIDRNT